ncbi:CgeB family protein [Alsobacter sp. R-9]
MTRRSDPGSLDIVILGLSLSSSWGNGHATTWRALVKGLHRLGHRVRFVERDVPWYAQNRDLVSSEHAVLDFYGDPQDLADRFASAIVNADAVIVGSYVPDGVRVLDDVLSWASGLVAFYDIDTPVTLAGLERGTTPYIAPRQIRELDVYFSFTGGPTLQRLQHAFGARVALPLYCCADTDTYRPADEPRAWDLGYLGTYSPDRQPTLERLLLEPARRMPHARFVVAGPSYPKDIAWPANVERIDHVPPLDHPSFYRRQRYTLNVTRADMVAAGWSPSVRLFEAAACGTAIISDCWDGIGDLFPPGDAIHLARSADDVVALLRDPDDGYRNRIAAGALRRVRQHHHAVARAGDLVEGLGVAAEVARLDALATARV